ncbi:MAG TPA: cupin domain-containing protein [Gammaproteobacteria bacterium]|nr:cupin domain-containing protein [Gammaproteobacteria bacterium]
MKRTGGVALLVCLVGAGFAGVATAQERPAGPPTLFSAPLADMPGKQLVVVALTLPPKQDGRPSSPGHRHPGSVYVYVTQGVARLGLAGEPVREVKAGESFFEPMGAVHTVSSSASPTEPALAIAVMIVPDGAPLVSPEPAK